MNLSNFADWMRLLFYLNNLFGMQEKFKQDFAGKSKLTGTAAEILKGKCKVKLRLATLHANPFFYAPYKMLSTGL